MYFKNMTDKIVYKTNYNYYLNNNHVQRLNRFDHRRLHMYISPLNLQIVAQSFQIVNATSQNMIDKYIMYT